MLSESLSQHKNRLMNGGNVTEHLSRIFRSFVFSLVVLCVIGLVGLLLYALYNIFAEFILLGVLFCYLFVVTLIGMYREETDLFDNWGQQ